MNNTGMILAAAVLYLLAAFAVNVRGLHLGKWVTGSGSILTLLLSFLLLYLLVRRWAGSTPLAHAPVSLTMPAFDPDAERVYQDVHRCFERIRQRRCVRR